MKKNIAMRVAAFLFILTMISTCAFATTFAKYTTSKEATDSARVAKWGVVITLETTTDVEYEFNTTTQDVEIYSEAAGKLLAPGSTVKFANIDLSGTPEVAVNVSYTAVLTLTGWDAYCPLIITVGDTDYYVGKTGINSVSELVTEVQNAIAGYSKDYVANYDLTTVENIPVTCSWLFEHTAETQIKYPGLVLSNENDTALGDAANGTTPSVSLKITCTVTQID